MARPGDSDVTPVSAEFLLTTAVQVRFRVLEQPGTGVAMNFARAQTAAAYGFRSSWRPAALHQLGQTLKVRARIASHQQTGQRHAPRAFLIGRRIVADGKKLILARGNPTHGGLIEQRRRLADCLLLDGRQASLDRS
jgi:hypothetical protein